VDARHRVTRLAGTLARMPRLNSRLPLLWRTPTSCQFGSLDPVAILRDTTVNEERALAVLREGTSLATLRALVGQWHMTPEELDDFLQRIEPALESESPPTPRRRISVVGCDTGRAEIKRALDDEWEVLDGAGESSSTVADVDLVVIVSDFVVPLAVAGAWLRRDTPHLLVVFDEQAARVGPLIVPGLTPCAHCIDEQRRVSDDCWPAIATQLMFAQRPETTTALRCRVACEVLLLARNWRDEAPRHATRLRITELSSDVDRGAEFSADCQCRALRGIESEFEDFHASQTMTPTTSSDGNSRG